MGAERVNASTLEVGNQEMSAPKYDELLEPLFKSMHELGGSASIEEQEERVAALMELSDEDLSEIHRDNKTKFSYRLAWARTYLKRYGVLTNSARGVWSLTAEGQKRPEVKKREIKRYVQNLDRAKRVKEKGQEKEPDELEELQWQEQALQIIKTISPDAFERLCQRILRESGFTSVVVTGKSGDGGIDGKGVVRLGGLLSFHVIFQCKRYSGSISPSVVRDFRKKKGSDTIFLLDFKCILKGSDIQWPVSRAMSFPVNRSTLSSAATIGR